MYIRHLPLHTGGERVVLTIELVPMAGSDMALLLRVILHAMRAHHLPWRVRLGLGMGRN